MLSAGTVFILGAGASMPFGFPSGAELRARLCTELVLGNPMHLHMLECGHSEQDIEDFRFTFERSAINSIDAFIARRPTFKSIAEHAIAAALIPLEIESNLHRGDWYKIIWNEMIKGLKSQKTFLKTPLALSPLSIT